MNEATCSTLGCDRPTWVKRTGECSTCQSRRYRRENPDKGRTNYDHECEQCGRMFTNQVRIAKFCNTQCAGEAHRIWCPLPPGHPVMVLVSVARLATAKPSTPRFRPEPRDCAWCGEKFMAATASQVYCSRQHKAKASRNRRRGLEHGWTSNFTWAEVMRVFRKFDGRCAYCDEQIVGLPDPDHVVPLSRGGCNSITNILPCCSLCNSDKRDLLLNEWNDDRTRRGLSLRITSWRPDDQRVWHLTSIDPGHDPSIESPAPLTA